MKHNFANRVVTAILCSPLHPLLGLDFALIEFSGRRSGQAYTVPVNAFAEDDGYLIISRRERTWWRNLRHRERASLRQRGRAFAVRARVIETPPEVAQALRLHLGRHPSHARFFGVAIGQDGEADEAQLAQAALERVLIQLRPT